MNMSFNQTGVSASLRRHVGPLQLLNSGSPVSLNENNTEICFFSEMAGAIEWISAHYDKAADCCGRI